ncbi:competence type IV pilus minor pilin ComGG [Neobacillus sp. DY30]|uniref:competence type IV pilus minor pilin ComGG n=1 Tax=Neobacillus sp. DY30 TaxID=3047871 RepID=UPI0024C07437|nr:competence type IV pilus minor pilin ComGG [Neobacillus sp. DY30]WHX99292.1 competence type IV pilus minor pilin ComGG [Neobacillus sp. DY30]
MKNNELGFTYPLTLAVLILFLLLFSFRVEQLLTERKLAYETNLILQEEYYFHSSVKKVEEIMKSGGVIPPKGTFSYLNGSMEFQAELPVGTIQKINFTLRMHTGVTIVGRGFFDISSNKMIKWTEIY